MLRAKVLSPPHKPCIAHPASSLRPAISSVLQHIRALVCDTPFLVARRYKLLFRMGQQLRRETDLQGALSFYADCRYVGARLRQIRVLEHLE